MCANAAMDVGAFDLAYAILVALAGADDAEGQKAIALLISNGHWLEEAKGATRERRQLLAFPWILRAANGGDPGEGNA